MAINCLFSHPIPQSIGFKNKKFLSQSSPFSLRTIKCKQTLASVVGQELLANQTSMQAGLCFWVREKAQSSAEVDYVIPYERYLIPVEVKSGATGRLRSLMQFIDQCDHACAIRLYAGKIQLDTLKTTQGKPFNLLSLPYYLAGEITEYVKALIQS